MIFTFYTNCFGCAHSECRAAAKSATRLQMNEKEVHRLLLTGALRLQVRL